MPHDNSPFPNLPSPISQLQSAPGEAGRVARSATRGLLTAIAAWIAAWVLLRITTMALSAIALEIPSVPMPFGLIVWIPFIVPILLSAYWTRFHGPRTTRWAVAGSYAIIIGWLVFRYLVPVRTPDDPYAALLWKFKQVSVVTVTLGAVTGWLLWRHRYPAAHAALTRRLKPVRDILEGVAIGVACWSLVLAAWLLIAMTQWSVSRTSGPIAGWDLARNLLPLPAAALWGGLRGFRQAIAGIVTTTLAISLAALAPRLQPFFSDIPPSDFSPPPPAFPYLPLTIGLLVALPLALFLLRRRTRGSAKQ